MKNKVKLIVNPFIRIAGGQALIWGFLGLIVSTLLCWISGYHYHGLLHFGPAPNPAWWCYLAEHLIVWLIPALLFYLGGLFLSHSRIRVIGKSTLSNVLVGHPAYEVTRGTVTFNGKDLLAMSPEDRAHEGVFLSFQTPVEIPGVSMVNFMRAAVNEQRKYRHLPALSASEFLKLMREKRAIVELDNKLANRSVNEGFSGGEKKRNEIFQMAMLEPTFAILDETDSGLDVDALRIVADGFNKLKTPQTSAMVITHYQRLLDYLKPDTVHVLLGGRIVKTGGPELAKEIEARGFDWIKKEASEL